MFREALASPTGIESVHSVLAHPQGFQFAALRPRDRTAHCSLLADTPLSTGAQRVA